MNPSFVRVLLVEDDFGDAGLVRAALRRVVIPKFELRHETTLKGAIQWLKSSVCDVVLLDLSLPDSTGFDTISSMRDVLPDRPILVLTGYDDPDFAVSAVLAGAQDYLVKGDLRGAALSRAICYSIIRKSMEDHLRLSERRQRVIVDMAPEAVLVVSKGGKIRFGNPAAESIFIRSFENLSLLSLDSLLKEYGDSEVFCSFLDNLLNKNKDSSAWKEVLGVRNGVFFPAEVAIASLPDPEEERFIVLVRDITERRRNEEEIRNQRDQLVRVNQQKDRFFSIIAHDLRAPFASILGFSKIIHNNVLELTKDKIRNYSGHVFESANKVYSLLENLLEWSSLQMERTSCCCQCLEIDKIIYKNINLFQQVAQDKGISLCFNLKEEVCGFGDVHMVDTIIRNLINNALKYTHNNGVITIYVNKYYDMIEIIVEDNGVGIDQERMSNLFNLEYKSSTPGTNGETGTGLGLVLCKELAERQGGKFLIFSTPGCGSRIGFTLPIDDRLSSFN
ncbi:putative Multi-sensor hybrid histidine [Azospirillaceae bacterium]